MNYDFDQLIERKHTGSIKWDKPFPIDGNKKPLPLWVRIWIFHVVNLFNRHYKIK